MIGSPDKLELTIQNLDVPETSQDPEIGCTKGVPGDSPDLSLI